MHDNTNIFTGRAVRGGGRPKENHHERARRHCRRRRGSRRGTWWSGIFGLRGQISFTTCVSWILTLYPTSPRPRRIAQRSLIAKIRGSTSTIVYTSVYTSPTSPPRWMNFSGSRWRRRLNALPSASRKSGSNGTHVPVGTWRVEWQLLLYGSSTAASGGPGFWSPA